MGAKRKPVGRTLKSVLAEQLKDPGFRHHFEQRKLVHEVAMVVRKLRTSAGLTQAELAEKIGTSQPTIARIEKGTDRRTPQWGTLRRIALATGRQLRLVFDESAKDLPLVEIGHAGARAG